MSRIRSVRAAVGTAALLLAACQDKPAASDPKADQQQHIDSVVAAGGKVDSILPIAEQIRRFQSDIADKPDTLRHASPTIKHLVMRWTIAIASNDTAALNSMLIDRAEFAYLFYPTSRMSKPPYEAPPQLLWGQILQTSEDGARKLLNAFGGASFKVGATRCQPPTPEGRNMLHEGCLLQVETLNTRAAEGIFFGTIVERDGRFKFLSYANGL
ncbi:MAG: hypothetical protein ACO1Q7_02450 [Gemmatimonas sp.]